MILEGLVTTLDAAGRVNMAPIGPQVEAAMERFWLRLFPTSQTWRNLEAQREGVLHITDDVLLLARAAVGPVEPLPPLFPAKKVHGAVLNDACRYFEFRIKGMDEGEERIRLEAEVVHAGRLRDFFGFNRAKAAVVEAAILATRLHLLSPHAILADLARLAVLVEKTGGRSERSAFALLEAYVRQGPEKQ